MNHYCLLTLIILGTGFWGGLANFLMPSVKEKLTLINFFRSLVFGLAAAAAVPLMLYLLSSNLIEKAKCNSLLYFVFGGYCLVFAIFAKRFLIALGNKLFDAVEFTKRMDRQEQNTFTLVVSESDEVEEIEYKVSESRLRDDVRDKMQDVITELKNVNYKNRTLKGLVKSTNIESKILLLILEELEKVGIARKIYIKDKTYYTIINKNIDFKMS